MGKIRVLDPLVSERIAAGEVIERPASIVKELVENAIDAGATEVQVRLEEGGKNLIEVTDNGVGMSQEDLELCALRHATSKIKAFEDLEKLATLGFRGEALPSIAACARLEIISQAKGSDRAHQVAWEFETTDQKRLAEPITAGNFLNAPHGTRVSVRSLFAQIPARLKFLKSNRSEIMAVREWLEKLALAHPEVGFELIHEGEVLWDIRPSSESQRVFDVLADGGSYPIVSENYQSLEHGIELRLHWIQGLSLSSSKKLVQILNGRVLRDKMLQAAQLQRFRQQLLPGQYPALGLYLQVRPSDVDVNVHPSKTEARFLNSAVLFKTIENLADQMIRRAGMAVQVPASMPTPWSSFQPSRQWEPRPHEIQSGFQWTSTTPLSATVETPLPSHKSNALDALSQSRYVGELFRTYLIFEGEEDRFFFLDQHAAHERVRYERLKKQFFESSLSTHTQALLLPETLTLQDTPETQSCLIRLRELGFEIEAFGQGKFLVRSVPAAWGLHEISARLHNLMDRLLSENRNSGDSALMDEGFFEALASEACHRAIRAGDALEVPEVWALIEDLKRCENPWNCPHGRPTIVESHRQRLEEWFQRKLI